MLRPFLMIGVGGSGGKTLRIIHHELERRLHDVGWEGDFPAGWQFLHVDVPSIADGDDSDLPPQLSHAEYAGLVAAGVNYRNIDAALAGSGRTAEGDAIAGWRPAPDHVAVPVERGAGQFRALGRIIALANLKTAKTRLDSAMRNIGGREVNAQLMELTRLMGGVPSPVVKTPVAVVVSSIAGGSGAGALIDICDLLRASGTGVWAGESVGILYSPDVFDYLDPARRRGVRPNALATLSELVAGYWNKSGPSKDTADILNRQGIVVGDAERLGPRYSFLVGAKNDFVTFRTQNDIYHAMGRSLASWVTSASLQDRMDAYVSGNWSASAISVPDEMGLKTNEMETPFTALGSARVGLGRDRFRDYAAQRLARAAVELLLERHEQFRARGDERQSRLIAQETADAAFQGFLVNSNLNERTEDFNQIIDAIRPETRQDDLLQLNDRLLSQVIENAPAKGLGIPEWRMRIEQRVKEVIDLQLDEFDVGNRDRGRAWVASIQPDLRRLAARTLSMHGYVVSGILFRKLADELTAVRTELQQESSKYQRAGENIESQIDEALRRAGGDVLPPNHPSVGDAVTQAVAAIHYRSEARLRSLVVAILPDFVQNVVLRLADEIENAGQSLQVDRTPGNGQTSIVTSWPDGDDIPKALRPAANEFLLEDPAEYGAALHRLIGRTVQTNDRDGAFLRVLQDIIAGREHADSPDQGLVSQPADWTPKAHDLQLELATPQPASYKIAMSAADLLERATAWLNRPGTPAGNFVKEGLDSYLDSDTAEPAELSQRLTRFEQQFAASVDAAQPLISIKKGVLVAVHHRNEVRSETFFTELPVAPKSKAAAVIQKVLESRGRWNAELAKSFNVSDLGFIDAFTVLVEPYEPVVFDSLMKPIAEEWGDRNQTADGREEFWRWRRARSLPEFIPAAPAVRKAMVRGWFTATMLGQVRFEDQRVSIFVPNTVGGSGTWRDFPCPLLTSGLSASFEYLPLVLEALPLAFVDVNVRADIAPILPYRRLRELGTSGNGGLEAYDLANKELEAWIASGEVPQGAPTPNSEQMGATEDAWKIRRDSVVRRVETLAKSYHQLFESTRQSSDFGVPRAYELRTEISSSFDELARAVRDHDVAASGPDTWN
ncbi:tubulin-like doman-containing protein [Nocardioides sp. LS1]|uniref:tubulin-like doman-containing protein n=1 Tax=Nocardioides sp. LS1 TaxID=1027620 RepID=UPI000F617824|nr:tubulin-like doman-containing protein [Nocardioides sp. LS1]GCD91470.1 hypothetical protein NLS1_34760 [Nocardioides sp. LS1]